MLKLSAFLYRLQPLLQKSTIGLVICSLTARRRPVTGSVAIVCYHTRTEWDGERLGDGVGGAEQAVVHLAEALASQGRSVSVYNNCGANSREIRGVVYLPTWRFNFRSAHELVILWRTSRLAVGSPINCRHLVLWCHDLPEKADFTGERLRRLSRVAVLSRFHRSTIPHVSDSKIFVTANGVLPPFSKTALKSRCQTEKNPWRCIYTSAPNRGLECLLRIWPRIRSACPRAELSVFYGWKNWLSSENRHSFDRNWFEMMLALLDQDGIVGKNLFVEEKDLWGEYIRASVWVYPTQFQETSCISAMKAQLCGAVPVVTASGALKETVQRGKLIEAEDIYTSKSAQSTFVSAVVDTLRGNHESRDEMIDWAFDRFSWRGIARDWHGHFPY